MKSLVFLQDPEKAHERVLRFGEYSQEHDWTEKLKKIFQYEHSSLECSVNGINFKNPVGLAAGFDKNGILTDFIESLGFGFEEVGSLTARGGKGNEKPRIWRLPKDKAIINRMGLNNCGAYQGNENLKKRKSKSPVGVNIAKTHDPEIMRDLALADFWESYRIITEGDYKVLNVSCPNTSEGMTFEEPYVLNQLLKGINEIREYNNDERPLFVKLSSDLALDGSLFGKLDRILQVCEDNNIDGYITINTSSKRDFNFKTSKSYIEKIGNGGLSGRPIRLLSSIMVSHVYRETKKTIIGVGGIFTAEDAYEKIKLGASLVQGITGFVYEGPSFAKNINKGLVKLLEKDGFKKISEAVGVYN